MQQPRVPSPALHKVLTRDKSNRAVMAAEKMTTADGETSSGGGGFSSSDCTRWKPDPGQLVPASQQGYGCLWLVPRTGRELLPGHATATASLPWDCSDNRRASAPRGWQLLCVGPAPHPRHPRLPWDVPARAERLGLSLHSCPPRTRGLRTAWLWQRSMLLSPRCIWNTPSARMLTFTDAPLESSGAVELERELGRPPGEGPEGTGCVSLQTLRAVGC